MVSSKDIVDQKFFAKFKKETAAVSELDDETYMDITGLSFRSKLSSIITSKQTLETEDTRTNFEAIIDIIKEIK